MSTAYGEDRNATAEAVARAATLSRQLTQQLTAATAATATASASASASASAERDRTRRTAPQPPSPTPPNAPAPPNPVPGAPPGTPPAASHGPRLVVEAAGGMAGSRADAAQRAHTASLVDRFTERTRTSKRLAQQHRRVLADSRAVVGFRDATKEMLYPIAARSAHGSRITDVDGNDYTDITMGFGSLLFGHEPEFVTEAVRRHLSRGLRLGPRSPDTGEAAALLAELTGLDRVAFAASGTEANSAAVRLARAATGRDKVVMFRGSYHGHIDSVLGRPGGPDHHAVPVSRGIPASAVADLIVLEYGGQEALDTIDALGDRIAAVLVEPVQCRNPALRPVEFLRSLRELTARRGIVLLFDEMLTGLRPHPRGAQDHFGVVPDLATYGKALGSGFPVGAVAGRADLLDGVDGGFWSYGDDSRPPKETTFIGGTYMQHPLSMAATKAVLTHLKEQGPGLQERLNARTGALAGQLNDFFRDEEFPLELAHFGSMFRFTHRADMELLYHHLQLRGVYVWEWRSFYLSTAHTEEDVAAVADAVKGSLRELRDGGFFPRTEPAARPAKRPVRPVRPALDFGVYFFGDHPEGGDASPADGDTAAYARSTPEAYDTVFETARFADEHGFSSLWLPERHFHSFGGLFPNPAVLASALARETGRIRINAGSVVLPLHDPVRVAEEWSVVDNLSGGRVGIGCATGWHAQDFALHPDRFADRREIAFAHLDEVRRLWRGEAVRRLTGEGAETEVRIHPRPVQEEPPLFLATSGQRDSYGEAARRGLGVVTNLMSQTVAELTANIAHYRQVRADRGLDPEAGRVTVLVHTYLGTDHDTARAEALEPMSRYLRSSLLMRSAATALGRSPQDVAESSEEDLDYLFRRAYDRYCDQRALIGTPESVAPFVDALHRAGVDEIAALVDFGVGREQLRSGLVQLDVLRRRTRERLRETVAPATSAQRRLWLASQLLGDSAAYNETQAVRLRGPLDEAALRTAVDGLVERHAGLRTVFRAGRCDGRGDGRGDETVMQVVRSGQRVPLRVTDARGQRPDTAIGAVLSEESTRTYDLAAGPLFTPRLVRLAQDDHALVFGLHHIITDAHSAGLIAADLQELYRAAAAGRPPVFERPAGTTVGAAEPPRTEADLTWWRECLGEKPPVLGLPTDRPRGRRVAGRGGAEARTLDRERTDLLREWSGERGVTLFATLCTAWQLVLRRRSGQDEFLLGTTFGRRLPETLDTVGFHVALLPLRLTATDTTPVPEAVRATGRALFDAEEHSRVDLDALLAAVHPDPGSPRPLITVSIDLDSAPLAGIELPGLRAEEVAAGTESAPLELALMATRTAAGGLRLRLRYDADLFDAGTARGYLTELDDTLRSMTEDGEEREEGQEREEGSRGEDRGGSAGDGTAAVLREVWEAVLDVRGFPAEANFFDLGGNSIAAIRLVNRVRDTLGVDYPLADFFAEATLRAMTEQLGGRAPEQLTGGIPEGVPEDVPETVLDRAPVSAQQARMIAGHHAVPRAEVWNVPTRITFTGLLDPEALRSAVAEVIARHDSLRTRFVQESGEEELVPEESVPEKSVPEKSVPQQPEGAAGGDWWQEVIAPAPLVLPVEDLTGLPPGERAPRADALCRETAASRFDLSRPALPKLRLLRVEEDRWALMFVLHHITVDGWSLSLLLAEIAELYTAAAAGMRHALPAPAMQAPEYARRQRAHHDPGTETARAAYCAAYLDGVPSAVPVPTDRPRPERLSGRGDTIRGVASGEVRAAVEEFASARHTTPFAVAAAALGVFLTRLSGEPDILLSVPYANREGTESESLVAMTSTAVMVRVRQDSANLAESCAEFAVRTGVGAMGAMAHVLPTARIMRAMRDAGADSVPDRVPHVLAFQNSVDTDIEIPGLQVEVADLAPPLSRSELCFGLAPRRDPAKGYRTFLEFSSDLWNRETAENLLSSYTELLAEFCAQPDRPVRELLETPEESPVSSPSQSQPNTGKADAV
ncbi:aminotransferase class III-fold pyridoxal phosphate-dependent enzyme [Streptomyces sp. NBC_01433]|uniref:MupA/Atu3671 family FMN-dependent luciferase-like monooxygenase n=1 Tax=Streptomyces sp. NBC_01433 TaxID=2903864 RepID=UPI002253393C|nr:MupA/Atu3671 family FMN-dependent luciferase-like monooxygenase [Streptomyces sp. NBC_01433]MCX4674584.1 aminotransferase class III-fold pyridoxal phosphate-dependent enzyme [Streptomyces sp. NBC_01433]